MHAHCRRISVCVIRGLHVLHSNVSTGSTFPLLTYLPVPSVRGLCNRRVCTDCVISSSTTLPLIVRGMPTHLLVVLTEALYFQPL